MAKTAKPRTDDDRPKKTQIPPVTRSKELRNIRYAFTEAELQDKSKQLATACTEKQHIEDEKKSVNSDFKAKIDAKTSSINLLSNHISNGFEMRNVECEVEKDFEKGIKKYFYDGKEYDSVPLTALDRQAELNFINQARAKGLDKENGESKEDKTNSDHRSGPVKDSDIPGATFTKEDAEEKDSE